MKAPPQVRKPSKINTQEGAPSKLEASPIEPREESSVSAVPSKRDSKPPVAMAIRVDQEDAPSAKVSDYSKPPTITPMSHIDNRSESKT